MSNAQISPAKSDTSPLNEGANKSANEELNELDLVANLAREELISFMMAKKRLKKQKSLLVAENLKPLKLILNTFKNITSLEVRLIKLKN